MKPSCALSSAGPSIWKPSIGIRPIEHDDRHLPLRRLLHHIGHRRHVGVEARADVLQIDDDRVEAVEHRCGRPAACRRRASGSAGRSSRLFRQARSASSMPRMPCSGLKSATSLTSLASCSRSIAAAPSRARPVWFVTRPTRLPCSGAKPCARSTSMPVMTGSRGGAVGVGPDGPKSRPVHVADRRRQAARRGSPTPRPSRRARAAASRRPCRPDARGSTGRRRTCRSPDRSRATCR